MNGNQRNLALFYGVAFLQGLCFYGPVATLYRQEAGLSVFQIGLMESVSMAAMLLLELPWGWAADRLGLRRAFVLCTALFALSKVVFWRAEGFGGFLCERLLQALALSGLSGCDSAYLFSCVGERESQRAFGRWNAAQTAGLLAAGGASSLFLGEDYRRAALWTVVSYALAALLALFLTDPAGEARPVERAAPAPSLRAVLRGSLGMAPFLVGAALLTESGQFVSVFLSQLLYRRAGIPTRVLGVLYVLGGLAALLGERSHALTGRLGARRTGVLLFALAGGACLGMALFPRPLAAVTGVAVLRASAALFVPLSLSLQNAAAHPAVRATQLSCNAMVMELVSAALNPAFGHAADAAPAGALLLAAAACGGGLVLFLYGLPSSAASQPDGGLRP